MSKFRKFKPISIPLPHRVSSVYQIEVFICITVIHAVYHSEDKTK